jgi:hypothetical protein
LAPCAKIEGNIGTGFTRDKEFTFDIKRPYTNSQHLILDYQNNTDEHDTTHFEEVIQLPRSFL